MGPWQWRAAQAPGGVWVVTCVCTQDSCGSSSSISGSCLSLGSELIAMVHAVSGACLGGALPSVGTQSRNPLYSSTPKQWFLAFLEGLEIFPDSLPASCGALAPSGCLHAANPSPLPGVWPPKPKPQLPAPTHPNGWAEKCLRLVSADWHWSCVGISPLCPLQTCCCTLLRGSEASPHPPQWRVFLVSRNFSSFTAPSQRCRSHPYSFVSVFFFSFALSRYVGIFLPFRKSGVFCQRSVGVL